jgi:hypothetical protein
MLCVGTIDYWRNLKRSWNNQSRFEGIFKKLEKAGYSNQPKDTKGSLPRGILQDMQRTSEQRMVAAQDIRQRDIGAEVQRIFAWTRRALDEEDIRRGEHWTSRISDIKGIEH